MDKATRRTAVKSITCEQQQQQLRERERGVEEVRERNVYVLLGV